MKRSRRVVLMVMGKSVVTGAVGVAASSLTGTLALARDCRPGQPDPPRSGPKNAACKTRGGFGGSPYTFNETAPRSEYIGGS